MTHRFPVKEIALQSGTSVATVDRVLHGRANVSPQTRQRILDAIKELEGQESQLSALGRRLFFDFLIESPKRFLNEVRASVEREILTTRSAVIRPRFTFQEEMNEKQCLDHLARIAQRGTHGLCLKLRDRPAIREAVRELVAKGIPIVALFTDIPQTGRLAYLGMDNVKAGQIAAYLITQALNLGTDHTLSTGSILITQSQDDFLNEEERADSFTKAIRAYGCKLDLINLSGGAGLYHSTGERLAKVLEDQPNILAAYSIGGGNRAILDSLKKFDIRPRCFVAHDLDQDNRALLAQGKLSYVLNDQVQEDVAAAFYHLLYAHKLCPPVSPTPTGSDIQILVPTHVSADHN